MPLAKGVPENGRIALLAEDDENDVLLIRRALERLRIVERLVAVSSGEEVLAYLGGELRFADRQRYPFPDVLLLDQFMPRWSGLEVLLWLRSSPLFEHLPVIVLSLGLSPAQTSAAQLLRAACCAKTMRLEELPLAMEQAIDLGGSSGWRSHEFNPTLQDRRVFDCARAVL